MNSLKRFNEVFVDLLRDLIQAKPNDMELRFYKTTVKGILLVNKLLLKNVFVSHMGTYKEPILKRDESFLLENNFDELNRAPDGIFMKIVTKLKGVWMSLTADQKELIWLHFDILFLMLEQIKLAQKA
jgi:hypothetical protein